MNTFEIKLDEETHKYQVIKNGVALEVDSSITQVLKAVDVAPNYDGISEEVLKHASELGTNKHAEMENYVKYKGATELSVYEDVEDSKNAIDSLFDLNNGQFNPEMPIVLEYKGKVIAGTIDLLAVSYQHIIDYKFTSQIHKDYVEAQLNLYAYAVRHFNGTINGIELNNVDIKRISAIHKGEIIECELWSDSKVEDLLDCYVNDLPYIDEKALQNVECINTELVAQEYELAHFELKVKQLTDLIKARREAILNEMLEKGIKSYEIGGVKYTAVDPTTKETFDSKKFKEDNPELYQKYKKTSQVKASLRVKVVE